MSDPLPVRNCAVCGQPFRPYRATQAICLRDHTDPPVAEHDELRGGRVVTLAEVARELKVSRMRVLQIERKALTHARTVLVARGLTPDALLDEG